MNTITGILSGSYTLLNEMSPYLLFGLISAGFIHVFVDSATIGKHFGKNNLSSIVKASLFGIPLPLCSCGVLPAAMSLRKDGASKGAVISFLISTPTTGIDSIMATYSLMGWVFAIFRVVASFFTGVIAGIISNIFNDNSIDPEKSTEPDHCDHNKENTTGLVAKVKGAFRYATKDLIEDIGKWLILGIIVGGAITYLIPDTFIQNHLNSGFKSMLLMLIIGIPMYVCATGSIPIAAALLLKGLNPGAAFVFLLAGPATNMIALTVLSNTMGKKTAFIYIFSISFCSILFGVLLNYILTVFPIPMSYMTMTHSEFIPMWISLTSSVVLLLLIFTNIVKPAKQS